jgi:AcrR family transcriptional regulator
MLTAKSNRAHLRRSGILDSAVRAMNDRGLRSAGMRDIARAAGLSTGNLYYYFRNKEELVYACQDRALDQLLEVLDCARPRPDAEERLGSLIDGHLRVVMDGGAALHLELDSLPKPLLKRIVSKRDRYERGVRELIVEGQREGAVRAGEAKLQVFALLGALNWTARWYRDGGRPGSGLEDAGSAAAADRREAVIHSFRQQLLRGLLWQRV